MKKRILSFSLVLAMVLTMVFTCCGCIAFKWKGQDFYCNSKISVSIDGKKAEVKFEQDGTSETYTLKNFTYSRYVVSKGGFDCSADLYKDGKCCGSITHEEYDWYFTSGDDNFFYLELERNGITYNESIKLLF